LSKPEFTLAENSNVDDPANLGFEKSSARSMLKSNCSKSAKDASLKYMKQEGDIANVDNDIKSRIPL